jgi:hypothetical protein
MLTAQWLFLVSIKKIRASTETCVVGLDSNSRVHRKAKGCKHLALKPTNTNAHKNPHGEYWNFGECQILDCAERAAHGPCEAHYRSPTMWHGWRAVFSEKSVAAAWCCGQYENKVCVQQKSLARRYWWGSLRRAADTSPSDGEIQEKWRLCEKYL